MKIFVIVDVRGDVQSVAVPDDAVADRVSMAVSEGGRAHALDVDPRTLSPDRLLEPESDEVRRRVYAALRARIGSRSGRRRR